MRILAPYRLCRSAGLCSVLRNTAFLRIARRIAPALYPVLALGAILSPAAPRSWAASPTPTNTTLAIAAHGSGVSKVVRGTVVTLTATVTAHGAPVKAGTVTFCDAEAKSCADIHLIGSAQIGGKGTAAFEFIPPPGEHRYKAVYGGAYTEVNDQITSRDAASFSSVENLNVTGAPTTTSIAQIGSAGSYTLTATVTGVSGADAPTGTVSFLDTSNSKAVVATATLKAGRSSALTWTGSQTPAIAITGSKLDPQSVAVGDFNEDGIPDLAIGTGGYVCLLLGKGDVTFDAPKCYAALDNNQFIAVGSFVPGGPQDILVASNTASSTNNAQLLIGDGKGGMKPQPAFSTNLQSITGLAVGDLADNGTLGFVVSGTAFGVAAFQVFLGNGDGTFGVGTLLPSLGTSGPVVVGDMNGDGIPDIAGAGSAGIVVFLGDGSGNFTTGVGSSSPIADPTSMATGDFNGDGKLDIAVTDKTAHTVQVYFGNGAREGQFTLSSTPATGSNPVSLAVGDFNGDGIADLAVANSGATTVTILLGLADGDFKAAGTVSAGAVPVSVAASHFTGLNGDGLAIVGSALSNATIQLPQVARSATAKATGIAIAGKGTHLIDAKYSGDATYGTSVSATVSLTADAAATPIFSPAAATYSKAQSVKITTTTAGAIIYYTTNGATPTTASTRYKSAIPVAANETIKAIAVAAGLKNSEVASAAYVIK